MPNSPGESKTTGRTEASPLAHRLEVCRGVTPGPFGPICVGHPRVPGVRSPARPGPRDIEPGTMGDQVEPGGRRTDEPRGHTGSDAVRRRRGARVRVPAGHGGRLRRYRHRPASRTILLAGHATHRLVPAAESRRPATG